MFNCSAPKHHNPKLKTQPGQVVGKKEWIFVKMTLRDFERDFYKVHCLVRRRKC